MIDLGTLDSFAKVAYEEVTLQATNSTGRQYQLSHVLISPLVNEWGTTLDAAQVLTEISGGALGRLEFSGAVALATGGVFYTSSADGVADSVRIVYSLSASAAAQSGTYTGTLTFRQYTLEGSTSDQVNIPMRVTVSPAAGLSFSEGSAREILLRGASPGASVPPSAIRIRAGSNVGSTVQVEQSFDGPPTDDRGHTLPLNTLDQWVRVGTTVLRQASAEQRTATNVESTAVQDQEITLGYGATIPPNQPAGVYRATVTVRLSSAAASGGAESLQVPLQVEVVPVLSLAVRSPGGGSPELRFTALKPGEISAPQTLIFEVQTNLGQSYEVAQDLSNLLTNAAGRQLPREAFICSPVGTRAPGMAAVASNSPIAAGRNSILHSDGAGTPTTIAIEYRIAIPESVAAGTYEGTLTFTLTSS